MNCESCQKILDSAKTKLIKAQTAYAEAKAESEKISSVACEYRRKVTTAYAAWIEVTEAKAANAIDYAEAYAESYAEAKIKDSFAKALIADAVYAKAYAEAYAEAYEKWHEHSEDSYDLDTYAEAKAEAAYALFRQRADEFPPFGEYVTTPSLLGSSDQ